MKKWETSDRHYKTRNNVVFASLNKVPCFELNSTCEVAVSDVPMSYEPLIPPSEAFSASHSFRRCGETVWIFDELPKATVVSVSRPETGDISPILLSYTIQLQYKQAHTRILVCFFLVFVSVFMYNDSDSSISFYSFVSLWSKLLAIMALMIS